MSVEIKFKTYSVGWADCEVKLGERCFTLEGISDTTDALGDLLRFALMIATGAYRATVSFDREPAEWRVVATSQLDSETKLGPVSIAILEFPNVYEEQLLASGHQVFIGDGGALEFAQSILVEIKRVLAELGPEGWGRQPYPTAALFALEAALLPR